MAAKKTGWVHKAGAVITVVALAALTAGYLARFLSPVTFWPLAFCGLALPAIFILNVVVFLIWTFRWSKWALVCLVFLLAGYPSARVFFASGTDNAESNADLRQKGFVKVMSYNVRLFDLYNWKGNTATRERILAYIREEDPDVVCFQEFYSEDNKRMFNNAEKLKDELDMPYFTVYYSTTLRGTDHWGMAIYSKHPLTNPQTLLFRKKSNNFALSADMVTGKDTLRIVSAHMQSIHFATEDYKFIENVMGEKEAEEELEGSKKIMRRLKRAFAKRAPQADTLATWLMGSPHKVVLCGDLNDSPFSYTYGKLTGNLKDAFLEAGSGFGQTYLGKVPYLRIDYILTDPAMETAKFSIQQEELSDHLAISCWVK